MPDGTRHADATSSARIGMNCDLQTASGGCHCGSVRFRVTLSDGLHTARRCNGCYCRMRGAVAVSAALTDRVIIAGSELLAGYQFGTKTATHYFCSRCGIHTHHQRRSNPAEYGVNVACPDGLSLFDFAEVPGADGVEHPRDQGYRKRAPLAGILRYDAIDN